MAYPASPRRKRFGQNFLHDPRVIGRIVAAISPARGDSMVEIGPGRGALTRPLLETIDHLHVVEIDRDLADWLLAAFDSARLTVHAADALAFDFSALAAPGRSLRVVGNLPYNISSALVFHLLAQADHIRDMHFMLQREVVERMASPPGRKSYGRLSVMVQLQCEVETLLKVGPGAFFPAPKVDSALVRLRPRDERPNAQLMARVSRLTAEAFARRRKTLRNALRGVIDDSELEALGLDPGLRPDALRCADFLALARRVEGR